MLIYRKPSRCMVCQHELQPAFRGVEDRVYGVPGKWGLDRCCNASCAALYLVHDLTEQQLASFYETYSTHSPPVLTATGLKGLYRRALKHIADRRLGYPMTHRDRIAVLARALGTIPYFQEMARSRLFWLPYVEGGRVIEVGFGNGQSMALLREAGWNVRGSELDGTCVSLARDMGFDAVRGEFTSHLFEAESADAIVASHAIEHVPDPRAFFEESIRVLRPGGRLVLRTPNAVSIDAKRAGSAWRGLETPRHLTIHTPGSLIMLAEQTGFTHVRAQGTPLGGFIAQQSRELRGGKKPAPRRSWKTIPFDALETLRAVVHNQKCAEIVLIARKP